MGWTISHAPYDETITRSVTSIATLARHVAHVVPSREWRKARPLFAAADTSREPIELGWYQAGEIANVLRLAAADARMPDDVAATANALADAAETAAKNREPWIWR